MLAERLPALMTLDEAAIALRCSVFTIRRMVDEGRLHAVRLRGPGSSIRIPARELRRLLTPNEGDPAA